MEKRKNSKYVCLSAIKPENRRGRKPLKTSREIIDQKDVVVQKVTFNFIGKIWEDFQTAVNKNRVDGKKIYPSYIFESIMADFLDENYIFQFLEKNHPEILEEYLSQHKNK